MERDSRLTRVPKRPVLGYRKYGMCELDPLDSLAILVMRHVYMNSFVGMVFKQLLLPLTVDQGFIRVYRVSDPEKAVKVVFADVVGIGTAIDHRQEIWTS